MLTADDWYLIGFYRTVANQNEGMAGMPRLEAYCAALDLYDYPSPHRAWLVTGALMLHSLLAKHDSVSWVRETGKAMRDITPEDVS